MFQEIYLSHEKIVCQLQNKNKRLKDAKINGIDSTLSFKYLRQLEAVFEAVPESVLQLIYAMRTGAVDPIYVVSIWMSVISMTKRNLNEDYTKMQHKKWDSYKPQWPLQLPFIGHALCRMSEITYRILLFALIWTVCGGLVASIVIGVEITVIITIAYVVKTAFKMADMPRGFALSLLNFLVVVPSDCIHAGYETVHWRHYLYRWSEFTGLLGVGYIWRVALCFANFFCCTGGIAAVISNPFCVRRQSDARLGLLTVGRIAASFAEFEVLLLYGLFAEQGTRREFLLSYDHGLIWFIIAVICFLIFSQYQALVPKIQLPMLTSCRSKWGLAYAGELTELQRIELPGFPLTRRSGRCISNAAEFWDEPTGRYAMGFACTSAALFAMANGHTEIVEWLEQRGAAAHKQFTVEGAALFISDRKWGFALRSEYIPLKHLGRDGDATFWGEPVPGTEANPVTLAMLAKWSQQRWTLKTPAPGTFDWIERQLPEEARLGDGESLDRAMQTVKEYMCISSAND